MKSLLALLIIVSAIPASALVLDRDKGKVHLEKIDEYGRCQSMDYGGDFCNAALEEWVAKHPADAFKAGKLTRLHMNAWGAIPFFAKAFAAKKGDCKDEDVWLAIESAAGLPDSYKDVIGQMKMIAFKKCFKELKEKLVKANSEGGYHKDNLCEDLKKEKAISVDCTK
jgi:hypothetical protein